MSDKLRELPSNIEAEQALLGALLIDNRTLDRVATFLEEQHFYEPLHQRIYMVCGTLISMGKMATPITVKSFLPTTAKVGDMTMYQYLVTLASAAVGTMAVRDNGIAIHEAWLAREAIVAATNFLDFAYAPPPGVDVIGEHTELEARIAQLRAMRVKADNRRGAGRNYLENMETAKERGSVVGIPIGIKEIQRVISEPSFEIGNYYGLLSSSGEGKTSLTVQLVYHALAAGCAVQFQSFDQSGEQIVRQMVAQRHRIEARRQRFGDLSQSEWTDAKAFADWIDQQPFEVVKCTMEGAPQLVSYARAFKRRFAGERPTLIVTDHIMRITPEKSTERADPGTKAGAISGILKAGTSAIGGTAWLMLNQRNTSGMQRANPRPIASDLFGGEGAKQSYDAVFYLYRFKKFLDERLATSASAADRTSITNVFPSDVREGGRDIAEIGALKVRFGPTNIRETLDFNAKFTLLESVEPQTAIDQEEMSFLQGM